MSALLPAKTQARIRREFPTLADVTYLNTASFGPLPVSARQAIQHCLDNWENLVNSDHEAFAQWDGTRNCLARMLNCNPEEIGFAFNTSYGLNIAAEGIAFKSGDEILLLDVEFPANVYPWLKLRRKGVTIKFLKSADGFFEIARFGEAITSQTRLLAVSFVQFHNGFRNDLEELGCICHERGIFLAVDGIQGVGNMPLDVRQCRIDLLAVGGPKWLLAPLGCGFFYLNSQPKLPVEPVFSGWLGVDWKYNWSSLIHYDLSPPDSVDRFGLGTYPYIQLYGLNRAVKLIETIGVERIRDHNLALLDPLIEYIQGHSYYHLKSSLEPRHRSAVLSFTCSDPATLYQFLSRRKIVTSYREDLIRVSVNFYNTREDINRLVAALKAHARRQAKNT